MAVDIHCTLFSLIDLGLGCSVSVPEIRVLKKVSNFFRDSPVIVPPSVHTKEKRKRHCSHVVICTMREDSYIHRYTDWCVYIDGSSIHRLLYVYSQ